MTPAFLPGDCLLYRTPGLLGFLVMVKTWHRVGHAEFYAGNGVYLTARAEGVDAYRTEWPDELLYVLRPRPQYAFNLEDAVTAFYTAWLGQGYDYLGLLRFAWWRAVVPEHNRQFCSEVVTRIYRAGGLDPFNGEDAGAVPPYLFATSNVFEIVYAAP